MNPPQPPYKKQVSGESLIADQVLSEGQSGLDDGGDRGAPVAAEANLADDRPEAVQGEQPQTQFTPTKDRTERIFFFSALSLWLVAAVASGAESSAQPELRWVFSAGRFGSMHLGTISFALMFWTLGLRGWALLVSGMMPPEVVSNRRAKLALGVFLKLGVLAALLFFIFEYPAQIETFCLVSAGYLILSSFAAGIYYFNSE